jgi:GDPmannose 4,6-dehydratase
VEAMWQILQQATPDDFVIGTGETNTLRDFVEMTFSQLGLDWTKHVETSKQLLRPSDIEKNCADPSKAKKLMQWEAHHKFKEVVAMLVEAELSASSNSKQNG